MQAAPAGRLFGSVVFFMVYGIRRTKSNPTGQKKEQEKKIFLALLPCKFLNAHFHRSHG